MTLIYCISFTDYLINIIRKIRTLISALIIQVAGYFSLIYDFSIDSCDANHRYIPYIP